MTVLFSLTAPVFVTAPPGDNRLFVVEQGGTIQVVERTLGIPQGTFLNISSLVSAGGGGLLGLAFDPQYQNNGRFFVSYVEAATGNMVVARYLVSGDPNAADANSAMEIIRMPQQLGARNGGMITFGPGGFLYIGWGDGGSNVSQNLGDLRGKILRVNVDEDDFPGDPARNYAIPGDNPCVGQAGALGEIWSMGLRNPRRFSFNSGELYIGEGGEIREEINVSTGNGRGSNYGWSIMDGSECSNSSTCNRTNITQPTVDYGDENATCSVIGGYVYRGGDIQGLAGTYFYADSCTNSVLSFTFNGNGQEISEHAIRSTLVPGGTITSISEDAQGELYITTLQGGLFRIVQ